MALCLFLTRHGAWSIVPYTVHGILATADIHMSVVTGLHLHGTLLISQWGKIVERGKYNMSRTWTLEF